MDVCSGALARLRARFSAPECRFGPDARGPQGRQWSDPCGAEPCGGRQAFAEGEAGPAAEAAARSLEERIAFAHSSHVACREAADALARARAAWEAAAAETAPAARLARCGWVSRVCESARSHRQARADALLLSVEHN